MRGLKLAVAASRFDGSVVYRLPPQRRRGRLYLDLASRRRSTSTPRPMSRPGSTWLGDTDLDFRLTGRRVARRPRRPRLGQRRLARRARDEGRGEVHARETVARRSRRRLDRGRGRDLALGALDAGQARRQAARRFRRSARARRAGRADALAPATRRRSRRGQGDVRGAARRAAARTGRSGSTSSRATATSPARASASP